MFSKDTRIGTLQFFYIIFEFIFILLFGLTICFGIYEFFFAIWEFVHGAEATGEGSHKGKGDFEALLRGILSAFEIFFLSPIPLLIIASFKGIIIKMYPIDVKIHPTATKDMIQELDAKKTFISSLIGVTSTLLLGQLIEGLSGNSADMTRTGFSATNDYFWLLGLALAFLIIQIVLYAILAAHSPHDKHETTK